MRFFCFALVFVVFVVKGESASTSSYDEIVSILKTVNDFANKVETYLNNDMLDKLQNETSIKEWSVNIQAKVTNSAANLLIQGFEDYKTHVLAQSPSDAEVKELNCISENENLLLQVVDEATRVNGWCNNRLAANLTVAFQETTTALLEINANLLKYAESLESCVFGPTICLTGYGLKVAALVKQEISEDGSIYQALQDVKAIYTIMFGTDVPQCYKEVMEPSFNIGLATVLKSIKECIA